MGSTKITITVDGVSEQDIRDSIDDEYALRVLKQPGACERCVMNEDPARVPMHHNCRCTVVIIKK